MLWACFEAPAMVTPELQGEVAQLLACNWELARQLQSCWILGQVCSAIWRRCGWLEHVLHIWHNVTYVIKLLSWSSAHARTISRVHSSTHPLWHLQLQILWPPCTIRFVSQWGLDEECTNVLLEQRPQALGTKFKGIKQNQTESYVFIHETVDRSIYLNLKPI